MTAGLEDHVAPAISSDTNDVIREPARVILRLWRADIEEEYEDYYGIEEAFLKFWGYAIVDSAEHKRHSMHIMPGEEHDKTYHITLDLNMNSACDKLVEDIRHLFYRGRKQDDKWLFTAMDSPKDRQYREIVKGFTDRFYTWGKN